MIILFPFDCGHSLSTCHFSWKYHRNVLFFGLLGNSSSLSFSVPHYFPVALPSFSPFSLYLAFQMSSHPHFCLLTVSWVPWSLPSCHMHPSNKSPSFLSWCIVEPALGNHSEVIFSAIINHNTDNIIMSCSSFFSFVAPTVSSKRRLLCSTGIAD